VSDAKNSSPAIGPPGSVRGPKFPSGFSGAALLLAWIGGLVLVGGLLWSFTQPLRDRSIMRSVNRLFTAAGESRRISAPMRSPFPEKTGLMGNWYSLTDRNYTLFVFSVMSDGIMSPFAAFVDDGGKVEEVVPLGAHSEQIMEKLMRGIMTIYIRRIEASAGGGER
jgi:hypothetical protein